MNLVLTTITPIILLIVLGHILYRSHYFEMDFWQKCDALNYYLFLPALILNKLAHLDFATVAWLPLLGFLAVFFVVVAPLSYVLNRCFGGGAKQLSSVYQGLSRFNSYLFYALLLELWGSESLALGIVLSGFVIPIGNVFAIASFFVMQEEGESATQRQKFPWGKIAYALLKNPLIICVLLGFLLNLMPVLLPPVLDDLLELLARPALPLALLSIGAMLRLRLLADYWRGGLIKLLLASCVGRLILLPMLIAPCLYLIGFDTAWKQVLLVFVALPTATSSFILSRQMKGDVELMVAIISLQTLLSMLSLPLILHFIMLYVD